MRICIAYKIKIVSLNARMGIFSTSIHLTLPIMSLFLIGSPVVPSSSSASKVLNAVCIVGSISTALPVGRESLKLLGGKEKDTVLKKGASNDFPEERIVIPVGITPVNLKNYTLYDVLGLGGELGASADTEVIKKAYHKAVLMYHPDKAQHKTADGKEDRTVFLKIQEAFTVLCSEPKRRAYDSQLPFDESIPTEERVLKGLAKGPHKFFKIFGPVFSRNARFAQKKPVPELGDLTTPINQVYKFYEYWVHFESWRDFTGIGAEYKPDDAGSRQEKRYMQQENEKLAKKLKKKEMERLIELVALAEKHDPRIAADKEKRKNAKDAEKNAKESSAKIRAEEDAASRAWAEQAESAVSGGEGSANKADKEKLKKAVSKSRNILRKLLRLSVSLGHGSGEYGIVSADETELLCSTLNMSDLNDMNDAMGGEPASKDASLVLVSGFDVVVRKLLLAKEKSLQEKEDELIAKEALKREKEDKVSADRNKKKAVGGAVVVEERDWTQAEKDAILTCLARYPPGTSNRWIAVTNYMNVKLNPKVSFTADECLRCAWKLSVK